ncbi:Nuclear transport factor 2 [Gracilariopsis chorda]|uniref:Nuclear transport factor 2 n=1 Tax=Gracilariopsis chorda TaxID=448386 RepID=A0A2V3J1E3_9FLOR|nr:Nuclear transport factor 2 [Gracilariopsis chorda]|eukprot:PXF47777.1 Nuclear transport factor 2 [Gracilariopsis chorda]
MADQMEQIGTAFVNYYYSIFDSNRENLRPLYKDQSVLTFEGQKCMGADEIMNKLTSLGLKQVKHKIITMDVQPTLAVQPNGILVSVSGNLVLDNEQNPVKFAQCFYLLPEGSNFWVQNDIFRLNYG